MYGEFHYNDKTIVIIRRIPIQIRQHIYIDMAPDKRDGVYIYRNIYGWGRVWLCFKHANSICHAFLKT